jgi:hypothetical protein
MESYEDVLEISCCRSRNLRWDLDLNVTFPALCGIRSQEASQLHKREFAVLLQIPQLSRYQSPRSSVPR